jgi:uncharacterized membrane protein
MMQDHAESLGSSGNQGGNHQRLQHPPPVNDPSYPSPAQIDAVSHRNTGSNSFASVYPGAHAQREQGAPSERARQFAKALGWFSVGLGVAQLLAPHNMSRALGVRQRPVLMRAIGAREIAAGVGLLQQRKPTGWLWARFAGDAMDLALLGAAARSPTSRRNRLGVAAAAVAGLALVDLLASVEHTQQNRSMVGGDGAIHLYKTITINRTPEECYRFWHDFENFPRFMKHLQSVQITGENRMHWIARAPAGSSVKWDAELVADQPGQFIAWRSLEGADIENEGTVRFQATPGGHGTIMRVEMQYRPPLGATGALVAKLFGEEPDMQIDEDLRRFKWLIETGEIPTTVGQSAGPRGILNRLLWRKGAPG